MLGAMHGCSPVDIITAVTALLAAVTALVRQFQHEAKVDKQVNGGAPETTANGASKPGQL